jgi:hypothetical protein
MDINGLVLNTTIPNYADGSKPPVSLGRQGDLLASEFWPRYYSSAYRGLKYNAANQAAQAVSVALATTYTGLLLYNPLVSGVNLVPTKLKFALSVAPAGIAALGLLQGYAATGGVTAQTSKLTATNNVIGGVAGKGIALSQATIVTPTIAMMLYDGFTAAALPAPTVPIDLEGMFVIPPGAFLGIYALTAVTGIGSIAWAEVPQ